MEVATKEMILAVERTHCGFAVLSQSVPVRETFEGKTV
jgi:hypothetical protein